MKSICTTALVFLLSVPMTFGQITIRPFDRGRQETEKTKNIYGVVQDENGKPIPGARVRIRNTKDNTTRSAATDLTGSYNMRGLPPDVTYEVVADFRGAISETVLISAMLDREDNLVNFQLKVAVNGAGAAAVQDDGPEFQTYDLVKLKASFEMPRGVPAPIPAVLLLHGFGEDRHVWESFRTQFLDRGWAVMSLDLRGHGDSKTKNQRPIDASPDWRTSPHEFPLDIDPALDWLKKQTRLDSRRIVIVGYDVGANLALGASGKFKEVRSVVAVNPNLAEALELAGSAQDFHPQSALVVIPTEAEREPIQGYLKDPFRFLVMSVSGGTRQAFQSGELTDAIFQWLKETY